MNMLKLNCMIPFGVILCLAYNYRLVGNIRMHRFLQAIDLYRKDILKEQKPFLRGLFFLEFEYVLSSIVK